MDTKKKKGFLSKGKALFKKLGNSDTKQKNKWDAAEEDLKGVGGQRMSLEMEIKQISQVKHRLHSEEEIRGHMVISVTEHEWSINL